MLRKGQRVQTRIATSTFKAAGLGMTHSTKVGRQQPSNLLSFVKANATGLAPLKEVCCLSTPREIDHILLRLTSLGVDQQLRQMILAAFESDQEDIQALKEARMNLAVLTEELKAQLDTVTEERDSLLSELCAIEKEFQIEDRRSSLIIGATTISPDARTVLRAFLVDVEAPQNFATLERLVGLPRVSIMEAVNELGMERLVLFGDDVAHPEDIYLSPKGRDFLLTDLGRRGAA